MTTNKDLEQLLGRSLDDDQESRRLLIARAGAAEGGSCGDAASHHGKDTEFSARIAMEKIIDKLPLLASPEKAFRGSEVMVDIVKEYMRSREKPVEERTLRTHLAALPDAERRATMAFFAEEARVSCAYEGIELNASGLAARLNAAIGTPGKSSSKE